MGEINYLYSLTLILLGTCVITTILAIGYVIGIIKYTQKYTHMKKARSGNHNHLYNEKLK
jgi:ABC-type siderophore export system fused ATPase/permease subunit